MHVHTELPVTGPGWKVDHTRVVGDIVMDEDASFPNGMGLRIERGGRLRVAGHRLDVSGAFSAQFDGGVADGLILTDPDDDMRVAGAFTMDALAGSDTEGALAAGTLTVGGAFQALAARAFVSTGTRVVLNGSDRQLVALGPDTRMMDLSVANGHPEGAYLARQLHVAGRLELVENAVLSNEPDRGADVHVHTELPVTGPGWKVDHTRVVGDIVMGRDASFPNGMGLRVERGGRLRVAGHRLEVSGAFSAQFDDGVADGLVMTDPADDVVVEGGFTLDALGPADTEGSFSAGTLTVGGPFQALAARALVSTGTHVVLDGTVRQIIALGSASRTMDLTIANGAPEGVVLARDLHVHGRLRMQDDAVLSNRDNGDLDLFVHALPPVLGPGFDVDHTRIAGLVALDADLAFPTARTGLVVGAGGRLTVAGHRLEVPGTLRVELFTPGVEGLVMRTPANVVVVGGSLNFHGYGGHSVGDLAAGTIHVRGDFYHTRDLGPREIFYSTGTRVVFDGDGTVQRFNGHTPQKLIADGDILSGTRFMDMVVAPGAVVDFGISTFANSSEFWVEGVADWAGTMLRGDADLRRHWVARTLILRSGLSLTSDAPICYGALVDAGGAVGQSSPPVHGLGWVPLQPLGTGDCDP